MCFLHLVFIAFTFIFNILHFLVQTITKCFTLIFFFMHLTGTSRVPFKIIIYKWFVSFIMLKLHFANILYVSIFSKMLQNCWLHFIKINIFYWLPLLKYILGALLFNSIFRLHFMHIIYVCYQYLQETITSKLFFCIHYIHNFSFWCFS